MNGAGGNLLPHIVFERLTAVFADSDTHGLHLRIHRNENTRRNLAVQQTAEKIGNSRHGSLRIKNSIMLIPVRDINGICFDHRTADNFHLFMFVDMAGS